MTETTIIPEQVDHERRLGRHIEHDPRSLSFKATLAPALVTTLHKRHSRILNQGDLGSCTGNAMVGLLGTERHYRPRSHPTDNEALAVKLYELATQLDAFDGEYPPDDTGSTGLAVAKAAKQLGLIESYAHAFGLDEALHALVEGPEIIGINWYPGFDSPDETGYVEIGEGESPRGGHEVVVRGLDVERERVTADNSWGPTFGVHGRFEFSFATFERLLNEGGDVTTIA